MANFTYQWKDYTQQKPGSYNDYTPSYTTYQTTRPTSTYNPTAYSDKSGAYASEIANARAALNKTIASKPSAYNSEYNDRINALIDKALNRKFQYDAANDSAYQLMKDNYVNLGRQAAADTAGQAAALTGGYGNSYGTVAANQAYQGYLNQLNDRIPELMQMALTQYQQEGSDLQNQYSMLSDRDIQAYNKYRDSVADWQTDRSYHDAALNNLRSMNQNNWSQNETNKYNASNQAWDTYMRLAAMNDSNRFNALNIGTERYKNALDNYWNGVNATEDAKNNAWNRAYSEATSADDLAYKYAQLAEDARQFNVSATETNRHNQVNEQNDSYSNKTARINASTSQYNAKTDRMTAENNSGSTLPDGSKALGEEGNSKTAAIVKKIARGELSVSQLNNYLQPLYESNQLSYREVYWLKDKYGV